MSKELFSNGMYKVVLGDYIDQRGFNRDGYIIVNIDTNVVEYGSQYLPDAISTAKGLLQAMDSLEEGAVIEGEIIPNGATVN